MLRPKKLEIMERIFDYCELLSFSAISFLFLNSSTPSDKDAQHVYDTLITFLKRGQIFVENFPPVSLWLGSYFNKQQLHLTASAAICLVLLPIWFRLADSSRKGMWILQIMTSINIIVLWSLIKTIEARLNKYTVVAALMFYNAWHNIRFRSIELASIANISDVVLLLAFLVANADYTHPKIHQLYLLGLPEFFTIIALLLGCNGIDFSCMFGWICAQHFKDIGNLSKSTVGV